ncbi:MAG: glycoside hydrolase family 1 protein [Myxococcales bacterium]|nr:glycoside hydrolase family 1 protein [Myxococcales bacterium]MCB9714262.1 glycoside hydrolase family 1 protein [Myxococcales bacterium]
MTSLWLGMGSAGCGDDGPGMGTTSDPSTGPEATVGSATGPGSGGSETAVVDDTQGSSTGEPTSGFGPIGPLVGPEGEGSFRFGAASAATQIEDANPTVDWYPWSLPVAEGGLGHGTFVGDAARGYSMALQDVGLMSELGLDAYRFSVEWARIEPQRDVIDEDALAHYDAFIDELLAAGIRPMITVHHFSNPTWVDDPADPDCATGPSDANLCGWNHPSGGPQVAEELAEHAALLAERYGDRVDEWATLNEPMNYLLASYGLGSFPPGKSGLISDVDGVFVAAARNFVAGHAAVYVALKEGDTTDADGDGVAAAVGLTKGVVEWVPARANAVSDHPDDLAAVERIDYAYHRLFVESIRQGGFDPGLDGELEEPHPEWAGTLDWLGVQYYTRAGVTGQTSLLPLVNVTPCFGDIDFGACVPPLDPSYTVPAMRYEHYPQGLYSRLVDFSARWPDLPLTVTESGIATTVGERRAEAIVRALESIARAQAEGVDVRGYYHWSLYDNYEWAEGFEPRFGLFTVDYAGGYARVPTLGVEVLAQIAGTRELGDELRATYGGEGPMTPEPR